MYVARQDLLTRRSKIKVRALSHAGRSMRARRCWKDPLGPTTFHLFCDNIIREKLSMSHEPAVPFDYEEDP